MVGRQPGTTDARVVFTKKGRDDLAVADQIPVREHHPLGLPGRTRGVLQDSQIAVEDRNFVELNRDRSVDRIGSEDLHALGLAAHALIAQDLNGRLLRRQRAGRLAVTRDALDPCSLAIATWRISRHGDAAGIKATEKPSDKLECSRRIKQQDSGTDGMLLKDLNGDGAGRMIQLRIGQLRFVVALPVGQIKRHLVRKRIGPIPKHVDHRRERRIVRRVDRTQVEFGKLPDVALANDVHGRSARMGWVGCIARVHWIAFLTTELRNTAFYRSLVIPTNRQIRYRPFFSYEVRNG